MRRNSKGAEVHGEGMGEWAGEFEGGGVDGGA